MVRTFKSIWEEATSKSGPNFFGNYSAEIRLDFQDLCNIMTRLESRKIEAQEKKFMRINIILDRLKTK